MNSRNQIRTHLTEILGFQYPIVQAGMAGGSTTPELVAAVSNAGGLGIFAGGFILPDQVRTAIRAIKILTDRPFGVNFLVAQPSGGSTDVAAAQRLLDPLRQELGLPAGTEDIEIPTSVVMESFQVVLDEGVPVLSLGLGDPGPYAGLAHESGMKIIVMIATVEEAIAAVKNGADVIAAQGADAGGHRSNFDYVPGSELPMVGTMSLVPQVVDAVDVPVLAAGGIADGRGLAAALALGADGALIGSRFLLASESGISAAQRDALLAATETDTLVTDLLSGRPARAVRNRLTEQLGTGGVAPLPYPLQAMVRQDITMASLAAGRADLLMILAGQGLRMLNEVKPATEIVEELVRDAGSAIERLVAFTR